MNHSVAPRLERSSGRTRLSFKSTPGGTVLDDLYQQGCCKVRFPRHDNGTPEAVLLNTAGGLTDGDILSHEIRWQPGARAIVTTQAAERIYRAAGPDTARISTRIRIDEQCVACWLPQETIVFDGSRLARTLEIDMSSSSRLVALESAIFGRRAMKETVRHGRISDRWRIWIDDRLAFADSFLVDDRLTGDISEFLESKAVANTAHCVTTMVVVSEDPGEIVERVRGLDTPSGVVVGVSGLERLAVLRILADDNRMMRDIVARIIAALGSTFDIALPRVWHC